MIRTGALCPVALYSTAFLLISNISHSILSYGLDQKMPFYHDERGPGVPITSTASWPKYAALETKQMLFGRASNLPMSFETNLGQTDPRVKFLTRGLGYSLFLTDSAQRL